MKVIVRRRTSVMCEARPRSESLERLRRYAHIIDEHIMKCVIYKDERSDTLSHWVKEVAGYLMRADRVNSKVQLRKDDYLDNLFGSFGTSRDDAELNLMDFQSDNQRQLEHLRYPDFEITDELIDDLYTAYQEVLKISLPLLLSKDTHSLEEWSQAVSPILNKGA